MFVDPATGHYLQSDPIGLDGGFNTYGYVNGNLLGAIDLLGLAAQCPASCIPVQSSAALRELSTQARVDGDVDAAYAYLRRALDVQNAVAACTLQGTAAGMSDEDAAILGGMVLNPSGTTPGGMPGSAGGGGRRNGGITNGVGSGGIRVSTSAKSAANGLNLNKSLASQYQMGESGTVLAGPGGRVPFRSADRVASEYGGSATDWVKRTSSSYLGRDGVVFETHLVENVKTGQRVEFKTKLPGGD